MNIFSFGEALEVVKVGGRITRMVWGKSNAFVFLRPSDELHIDMVIDKVKSLPQSVKDYYRHDVTDDKGHRIFPPDENDKIKFAPYLCLKNEQGEIENGWIPSQADMISNDWYVFL